MNRLIQFKNRFFATLLSHKYIETIWRFKIIEMDNCAIPHHRKHLKGCPKSTTCSWGNTMAIKTIIKKMDDKLLYQGHP